MGFCSRRYLFLSVCLLQMVIHFSLFFYCLMRVLIQLSVVERQIFDFLGFLWVPILVNFFEIVFIILGFFGAYQYRPKYIISVSIAQIIFL